MHRILGTISTICCISGQAVAALHYQSNCNLLVHDINKCNQSLCVDTGTVSHVYMCTPIATYSPSGAISHHCISCTHSVIVSDLSQYYVHVGTCDLSSIW